MMRTTSDLPANGERGAALMTVIMMVAMISALAITVVEAARFGIRRTANQEQMEQTRWYLQGAEAYATGLIERASSTGDAAVETIAQWLDRTVTLPVDGGAMQITVWDGSNCFNLNSVVVRAENGQLIANPDGMTRFALLLDLSGVLNGRTLSAALADWIDSDTQPLTGGAEARAYGDDALFRPTNTLLGDVGDLLHVEGFTPDVVARISRLICVRPTEAVNPINVETIRSDQARLLAAMVGRDLPLASAEQVIADRPAGGWTMMDAFLNHPRLAGLGLSDQTRAQFVRTSDWYVVGVRVQFQDVSETSMALVRAVGGQARIMRRVFGTPVTERRL